MLLVGLASPPPIAVVSTLFVLTVVASLSPVGALAAVAATLPWFYHPISVGSQHFAASELLLVAATGGYTLQAGYMLATRQRPPVSIARDILRVARSPLVLTLLTLTFAGGVLALYPYDPGRRAESLREWRWTLVEPLVFVALLTLAVGRTRERMLVATGFLAGGVGAALQAFTDLVAGGGVDVAGVTRIAGPYPHPNALALMEARVAAFALAWWAYSTRKPIWLLVPSGIAALAVGASLSRGAMLALAIGGLLIVPRLRPGARSATVVGAAAALAILVVVARDRMLDLFSGGSGSLRVDIWSAALEMIQARPIIGYGPDQFLYAYLPRYVEPTAWAERFTAHAHNLILDFWIRLGIIGLAFTVMVVVVCARLSPPLLRARLDGGLRAAAIIALVASLTHGLIDNAYFAHDLAMSGWLLGWLAFTPSETRSAEGADNGARPGYGRRWVHRFPSLR